MYFEEESINLQSLSSTRFEELCFDLLIKYDFHNLLWRKGGADDGRDIEGYKSIENPLIGTYKEKWFFECKRHERGISPEQLNSKIAWADAKKPHHFLIFVSSYLTNNCRTWLKDIKSSKTYSIHILEGVHIKKKVILFPDLVSKYFFNKYEKLFIDLRMNWLIHGLYPDSETLFLLFKKIELNKLDTNELGFFWIIIHERINDIYHGVNFEEFNPFERIFGELKNKVNHINPLLELLPTNKICSSSVNIATAHQKYPKSIMAKFKSDHNAINENMVYSFYRQEDFDGIEVLIEAKSDFPVAARFIAKSESSYYEKIYAFLAKETERFRSRMKA